MHGAPSVSHPVGRSRFAGVFIVSTWLVAAAGVALWMLQVQASQARVVAVLALLAVAGATAWRGWLRAPEGVLSWDGEGWSWADSPQAEGGMPEAVLDLQHVLLLRWRPAAGAVRWLWAERRLQPSTWDDLRRAVYSRVRP